MSTVQNEVLAKVPSRDLRAYFVWLPILKNDDLAAARASAAKFPDPRITHFWDGDKALGWALGELLKLPARDPGHPHGVAWDAYLLYAPGLHWKKTPPLPTYWMHQLWGADELAPLLDGVKFREQVEGVVKKK